MAALLPALPAQEVAVLQRVNAGGPALAGTPGWQADTSAAPSPYANTYGGPAFPAAWDSFEVVPAP